MQSKLKSVTKRMRHIMKDDRWALDSVAILVFAMGMAAAFELISGSGEKHSGHILAMAGGGTSWVLRGGLAWDSSSYIPAIRSWAWLSIAGAFIYTLIVVMRAIPDLLARYYRFHEASEVTKSQYLLNLVPSMMGYFALWAATGAIFIATVRFTFEIRRT